MNSKEFQMIMERLDQIERKIDFNNDPVAGASVGEKARIMADAIRSGDKGRIKEAKKIARGGAL